MTTFWIVMIVVAVLTLLSILGAPSQRLKPDDDPIRPRWYWFT